MRATLVKISVGLAVLGGSLAFIAASATAGQQTFPVPRALLDPSPAPAAIAGGAPVYARSIGNGQIDHLVRVTASGAREVPGSRIASLQTALGSADHLAETSVASNGGWKISLGPPAGPLTPVASCVEVATPVLTDEALAYVNFSGCNGPESVRVLDLRSGGPRLAGTYTDASGGHISLAGHLVAYRSGTHIVVRDWTTGQLVQSVTPEAPTSGCSPNGPEGPTRVDCSFAVDADGSLWQVPDTIEFVCGENCDDQGSVIDHCDGQVDRTPPGGPTQTVAQPACTVNGGAFDPNPIWVSGGRVLYERPGSKGVTNASLWLAGTDGTSSQVGQGTPGAPSLYGHVLGYTGSTLTLSTPSCTKTIISTFSLPLSEPMGSTTPKCPVKLSNAVLKLEKRPTLSVTVACPNGCVGPLFVCPPGPYGCPLSGPAAGISGDFSLAGGARKRVTLRMRPGSALVRHAVRGKRSHVTVADALLADDPHSPWLGDSTNVHVIARVRGARG